MNKGCKKLNKLLKEKSFNNYYIKYSKKPNLYKYHVFYWQDTKNTIIRCNTLKQLEKIVRIASNKKLTHKEILLKLENLALKLQ